jgi:hypothetical protein
LCSCSRNSTWFSQAVLHQQKPTTAVSSPSSGLLA